MTSRSEQYQSLLFDELDLREFEKLFFKLFNIGPFSPLLAQTVALNDPLLLQRITSYRAAFNKELETLERIRNHPLLPELRRKDLSTEKYCQNFESVYGFPPFQELKPEQMRLITDRTVMETMEFYADKLAYERQIQLVLSKGKRAPSETDCSFNQYYDASYDIAYGKGARQRVIRYYFQNNEVVRTRDVTEEAHAFDELLKPWSE